jgi:inosine/guanosine/xanthosine phosphorylase family protein
MLSVGFLNTRRPVLCLSGRPHAYEGATPADIRYFIRTCRELGCERILITNAAGSLRSSVPPGELVITKDHINCMGFNPLVGEKESSYGPRFLDMSNLYNPALRATALRVAESTGVLLHEGVFAGMLGPSFETPAEIKMLRTLGADTVAMSLIPEAIVAHHCGMEVLALSVVTNLAAGLTPNSLSHEDTLEQATQASSKLQVLLTDLIPALEQHGL